MTESEILTLYIEMVTVNQTVMAAWFTITFGLYSLAYITGARLKLETIVFIVLSYILLTYFAVQNTVVFSGFILSLVQDIVALQESGSQLSNMSLSLIQEFDSARTSPIEFVLVSVGILAIGMGAIGYLIYRYREGRRQLDRSET